MANVQLFDLARMTVSSSGTGDITVNAAVTGFNTFDLAGCSTASTGQPITYAINDTTQSEIASSVYYSSSKVITRGSSTTGLHSTNSNSPIDMSNAAQVFITPNAADLGLTGQIPGTSTNDNASAGNVGEFISSTVLVGSAVSCTTNNATDVTSIALTAGDWDLSGNVITNISANLAHLIAWISTTSATAPTKPNGGMYQEIGIDVPQVSYNWAAGVPTGRISLSAPTTVYLSGIASFTSGTCSLYGFIGARRVR